MKRILLSLLAVAGGLAAQPYYNLDFETVTRGRLRGWGLVGAGYEMTADDSTAAQGKYSMRIRSTNTTGTLGNTVIFLPVTDLRGRRVKISGWIKTENIAAPGYAAIWFRVDGASGTLSLDNMSQLGIRGTGDWRRYEYEREVSTAAVQVVLGTFLAGQGTAWFDDLRVEIDGAPLRQGPAPEVAEPTPRQLDWIRQNAIAFRTERAGSGFDDLQPLKQLIGNARLVGLGEATHGTAEFFRMKHRILEFLANEMGFTIFNIEANMPEAYRLNDYVLTGRGDPKRLLIGMYFWTWNTQEVLEMVEWMREFNSSGRGRVQFTGNDMQTSAVAAQIAQEFIAKAEPGYAAKMKEAYGLVERAARLPLVLANLPTFEAAGREANAVRRYLESRYPEYVKTLTLAEVDWAVQNARVVEQRAHYILAGSLHRDEMMALNTDWVLQQNPGAKMVLWAHNGHVWRGAGAQGSYLSRWYGPDYVVLGFSFGEGMYSAVDQATQGRLRSDNVAVPPYLGSAEYVFRATGLPRFILDLRKARADNGGAWLLAPNEARHIGSVAIDGYLVRDLPALYDALIYFDKTAPSVLLPFN